MSADLRDLYQEIILDHSRHPHNAGELADATGQAQGNNPLCGDRVTVYVKISDGRVDDARFVARGCAISVASASMMTDAVKGKRVAEAGRIFDRFLKQLTAEDAPATEKEEPLGALMGVREFPTRVKCATLPWHTFVAALKGSNGTDITTE